MLDLSAIKPTDENALRFRTYLNYFENIHKYLSETYRDPANLVCEIWKATCTLQTTDYDQDKIRNFARLSWNTEYILSQSHSIDPQELRIQNQWKPIQAYYAIYTMGEVCSHLLNRTSKPGHDRCLTTLSSYLKKNPKLTPWAFCTEGKLNDISFCNFRSDMIPKHNLQKHNARPDEIIAKCLGAEHKHRISENFRKKKGHRNFKKDFDPGPTTLLHLAYRLRIKANYRDADMYLSSEVTDSEISNFEKYLQKYCLYTLYLLELVSIRRMNKGAFLKVAKDYIATNPKADTLKKRVHVYEHVLK